jgi:hypothetical protein
MRLVSIRKKRHYLGKNKMFRLDLMIQRKVYKQDFAEDIQTAKALRNNYVKDGYAVSLSVNSVLVITMSPIGVITIVRLRLSVTTDIFLVSGCGTNTSSLKGSLIGV